MTPYQSSLVAAVQAHIDAKAQEFTFDNAADLYLRAALDQSPYFTLAHAFAGWVDDCWRVSDVVAEANKEIARKVAESKIAKQERKALALSALAIEEAKRAKDEEELFMMMVMVIEAEEQA